MRFLIFLLILGHITCCSRGCCLEDLAFLRNDNISQPKKTTKNAIIQTKWSEGPNFACVVCKFNNTPILDHTHVLVENSQHYTKSALAPLILIFGVLYSFVAFQLMNAKILLKIGVGTAKTIFLAFPWHTLLFFQMCISYFCLYLKAKLAEI